MCVCVCVCVCVYIYIYIYTQVFTKNLGGFDTAVDEYFAGMEKHRETREDEQELNVAKKKVSLYVCGKQ